MEKFSIPVLALLLAALPSCSRESAAPRAIRAHTRIEHGIAHADPVEHAERYCSYCHGAGLTGGAQFEPSCYECHGKNWLQDPAAANVSAAPVDHTVLEGGRFRHKATLFTPDGDCTACHGGKLEGSQVYPACTLCHTELWKERTPVPFSKLKEARPDHLDRP